jgi:hypothetical protein
MANTTTIDGNFLTITVLDADWSLASPGTVVRGNGLTASVANLATLGGIFLKSIQFHPSAASDVMIIHNEHNDGAELFYASCTAATDERIKYFNGNLVNPFIDITDCTIGTTGAKVTMEFA